MNITRDGEKLIIAIEGSLETRNAPEAEKEIMDALAANKGCDVIFDLEKLEYISSAGLRVLLKTRKTSGKEVKALNVSRDVYDIFDITGFTQILEVERAAREISVDGLEVIGTGFYGTVYRLDRETIVKVYSGEDTIPIIENEKEMAQKAFLAGIPTAISYDIVKVGENYGSVFELLDAKTFHEIAQDGDEPLEELVKRYVDLLKLVHSTKMNKGDFPSYKDRFLEYMDVIGKHLSKEEYDGVYKLLDAVEDQTTVVHGDIQMKNVMNCGDEPMLIDMETLGLGNPVFELGALYVSYQSFEEDDPDNAMSFFGMTNEMVNEIWRLIEEYYFADRTEEEKQACIARVKLAAALRFLYLLEITDLKEGELGEKRIAHTREHIDELLQVVDKLEI